MKTKQSVLARFVTLLTLIALVMPAMTVLFYTIPANASASYDADCGTMVVEKADMAKDHHKSKPGQVSDNCCISHHCCAAKMVHISAFTPVSFAVTTIDLAVMSNQFILGQIIHGLDRPPKSLV